MFRNSLTKIISASINATKNLGNLSALKKSTENVEAVMTDAIKYPRRFSTSPMSRKSPCDGVKTSSIGPCIEKKMSEPPKNKKKQKPGSAGGSKGKAKKAKPCPDVKKSPCDDVKEVKAKDPCGTTAKAPCPEPKHAPCPEPKQPPCPEPCDPCADQSPCEPQPQTPSAKNCNHHKNFIPPGNVLCRLKDFELKSSCTSFHVKTSGHDRR